MDSIIKNHFKPSLAKLFMGVLKAKIVNIVQDKPKAGYPQPKDEVVGVSC